MNSLIRADKIMELIGLSRDGLSHTQIHAQFDVPKSSLSRTLATLVSLHYLTFDDQTRRYRLGHRLLTLSGSYLSGLDIFQIGRDFTVQLSKITNESATLVVPEGDEVVLIAIENVPQNIIRPPHPGVQMPMYATAAGKAILAHKSNSEIQRYFSTVNLEALTPHTVTNPSVLLDELKKIKKGGFAYSWQGFREHVVAIGTAVFDVNGKPVASLSLSILTLDAKPAKLKQLEKALAKVANDFSRSLGYASRKGIGE